MELAQPVARAPGKAGIRVLAALLFGLLCADPGFPEEALRRIRLDGKPYVSVLSVARAASGSAERLPGSDRIRLRLGKGEILLAPGVPLVWVGSSPVRLPDSPRLHGGAVYVPERWFLPLVESLSAEGLPPPGPPAKAGWGGGEDIGRPPGSLAGTDAPRASAASSAPPTSPTRETPEPRRGPWLIHTVILDPGHGGKDQGAVGPGGLEEKEVALRVALRLQALLEERLKVRVFLTRDRDVFVPLGDRAKLALEREGSLFISLHCNASARGRRRTGGTEVYFLSEARTEEAREVARRENAALELEGKAAGAEADGNPVLRDIFEGMSSDQFLKESQDLAAEIRAAVARAGGQLKDRGVKQAGFYVMKGTQARMPSVLVEMAFISSPREERLLRKKTFQAQLAEAICQGVAMFKSRTEREVASP